MPETIKITDQLGMEILSVDPSPFTVFQKYLPGKAGQLVALPALAATFRTPLMAMGPDPAGLGFSFSSDVDLDEGQVLTFSAGARGVFTVAQGDAKLFEDTLLGAPLDAPAGRAWVALSLTPKLGLGFARPAGDLRLGFKAGSESRWVFAMPVPNTDPALTMGEAAKGVLAGFLVPASVDDLRQIPPGCVASVSGQGSLKFSVSGEVGTSLVPLAAPKLPIIGAPSLKPGASVTVGASCTLEGAYEIRAERLDDGQVKLSVFQLKGSDWTISVKGGATAGGGDLLPRLFRAISADPEADVNALFNAGLSPDQISRYTKALMDSVDRSLALGLTAEFGGSRKDDAAFSYLIDLAALAAEDEHLVTEALSGNLEPLTDRADRLPAAIQPISTRLHQLDQRRSALKINVLGIFNFATFSQLVREGTLVFDHLTGELTITDKTSWERIALATAPGAADGRKLRELVFESAMFTTAYRASGAAAALQFSTAFNYFEEHAKTNRQAMKDNLDAVAALELIGYGDRDGLLGGRAAFGHSTMALALTLDDAASRALFLQSSGEPYPVSHYDTLARQALLALVRPEDGAQAARRLLAESDARWNQARKEGQTEVARMFRHLDDVTRSNILGDYSLMVWWADAMSVAAGEVAAMARFLANPPEGRLDRNPEFLDRREALAKRVAKAIGQSRARLNDPWGLVAMDMASGRLGGATALVVADSFRLDRAR